MDIVLTGSVAFDYLMKFPGYFRDHLLPDRLEAVSLSFLVESMVYRRGGIAPNIAYTMALLGGKPRVMATVGEDCGEYLAYLSKLGVDTTWMKVVPGVFTASFFANTDRANAQIASFYPGAMAYAGQLSFYDLENDKPDLVVISPNDPAAMEKYVQECQELQIPYLYDPSQQLVRMQGPELERGIQGAWALFVNEYEFGLVEKMTGMSTEDIVNTVNLLVVTHGKNGSTVYAGGEVWDIPVVPQTEIVDPTGVGDAYRGGFLTGLSLGLELDLCGRIGALASTYCLEQEGPQGHTFTPQEFITRFRQHFDDGGRLDQILLDQNSLS
jgi:adenosine kinase